MKKAKRVMVIGIDAAIPQMVQKFTAEGSMPNVRRLMENGGFSKVLTGPPAITPCNWNTLSTGAYLGTHGIPGFWMHFPGYELDKSKTEFTFYSSFCKAELMWEAAEKSGKKSILMKYTTSWPPKIKEGFHVDGFCQPYWKSSILEIAPAFCYSTKRLEHVPEPIKFQEAHGWEGISESKKKPLAASLAITPKAGGETLTLHFLLLDSNGQGFDRVLISTDKTQKGVFANIGVGEWSSWKVFGFNINGVKKDGPVRFKLIELSPDGQNFRLYSSQIYPTKGFTYPDSLGEELFKVVGPFQECISDEPYLFKWVDLDTAIQEAQYQASWMAKATDYLTKKVDWSIFYTQWHFVDLMQHNFLGMVDPFSAAYDRAKEETGWKILRLAYKMADDYVGELIKNADQDTAIIFVSDHGCVPDIRKAIPLNLFKKEGLIVTQKNSQGVEEIDWSRTKVWVEKPGNCDIYVNLKGRDPHGSVEPKDYDKVRDQVIDVLMSWKDPKTGKHPIALVLKKEDAALVGYWGDRVGDLFFVQSAGYAWSWGLGEQKGDQLALFEDVDPNGYEFTAHHGPQIPTAETKISSNYAVLVMSGPGIKKGYKRPVDQIGPVRLVDIVPTLAHLINLPPPAQSQGAVLNDFLEGVEPVHPRASQGEKLAKQFEEEFKLQETLKQIC